MQASWWHLQCPEYFITWQPVHAGKQALGLTERIRRRSVCIHWYVFERCVNATWGASCLSNILHFLILTFLSLSVRLMRRTCLYVRFFLEPVLSGCPVLQHCRSLYRFYCNWLNYFITASLFFTWCCCFCYLVLYDWQFYSRLCPGRWTDSRHLCLERGIQYRTNKNWLMIGNKLYKLQPLISKLLYFWQPLLPYFGMTISVCH